MGFSNGLLSVKSEKNQKGEKGDRGVGFKLTSDRHFHLEDRRLTNLAPPVHKNDAVTKGHLTDALKAKAGTNYVNKELEPEVNVCLVHNGSEKTDYEIVKESDSLSNYTVFQRPLEIKAGDRINFHSDSSVRHAIVNILIEIDI